MALYNIKNLKMTATGGALDQANINRAGRQANQREGEGVGYTKCIVALCVRCILNRDELKFHLGIDNGFTLQSVNSVDINFLGIGTNPVVELIYRQHDNVKKFSLKIFKVSPYNHIQEATEEYMGLNRFNSFTILNSPLWFTYSEERQQFTIHKDGGNGTVRCVPGRGARNICDNPRGNMPSFSAIILEHIDGPQLASLNDPSEVELLKIIDHTRFDYFGDSSYVRRLFHRTYPGIQGDGFQQILRGPPVFTKLINLVSYYLDCLQGVKC